jgi:hypothetical protein
MSMGTDVAQAYLALIESICRTLGWRNRAETAPQDDAETRAPRGFGRATKIVRWAS